MKVKSHNYFGQQAKVRDDSKIVCHKCHRTVRRVRSKRGICADCGQFTPGGNFGFQPAARPLQKEA